MVAGVGIERRNLYGDIGARGTLFYTRAPETVLPQTQTLRGMLFYQLDLGEDDLAIRFAGGSEIFHAQVKQPDKRTTDLDIPASKIPQQVLAPLVSLSLHSVVFKNILLSMAYTVTPLYLSDVGYYPSTSPSFEIGFKFFRNWIATLQTGSELHRYPSVLGETKLQMDYALLTFKRGIF
jgi:hypothetical protein